jgi:hypothetical protein
MPMEEKEIRQIQWERGYKNQGGEIPVPQFQ